jgi:hypothetical protein
MQYLLMIYAEEAAIRSLDDAAVTRTMAAYADYTQAMKKAGVYLGSNRLRPTPSARTVRVRHGTTSAVDGPFAETKEQLGGYFLIDAPDMETAAGWAARCPGAAHGAIEVRPVWTI